MPGSNAATHLARAGRSVVVIDGDRIGEGASTRSGGMVSSGQKLVRWRRDQGDRSALFARLIGESTESFDYLKMLVETRSWMRVSRSPAAFSEPTPRATTKP